MSKLRTLYPIFQHVDAHGVGCGGHAAVQPAVVDRGAAGRQEPRGGELLQHLAPAAHLEEPASASTWRHRIIQ